MSLELNLLFPSEHQVIVRLGNEYTKTLGFESPMTQEDHKDIRWYAETYAALYTADVDDDRAERIVKKLPEWGEKLFNAVFYDIAAQKLFFKFYNRITENRLVTVSAEHPAVLSLPWELLCIKGKHLFHEDPRIPVRRCLADTKQSPFEVKPKEHLHLLFVVSRPIGESFIDPRSDPQAMLDALKGRSAVNVEFLRPATLQNLENRLKDDSKPQVDILHFDGHGAFDKEDSLGYLLFMRQGSWTKHLVPAHGLGEILSSAKIPLVILSACQSAAIGDEDEAEQEPVGTVAVQLNKAGIPSVIAMTHSVLVNTTRALFSAFYQYLLSGKGTGESLDDARNELYKSPERGERQRGMDGRIILKIYDWFLPALYQSGKDMPLLTNAKIKPSEDKKCGNLPELQKAGFFGRSRELWEIEQAFVRGIRRITITGFGGEGKTYLAIEAGNWLHRTGMFERVCFVGYAGYEGIDAASMAVSTLSTVLDESLLNADAAAKALEKRPVLMILDNLESLPDEARQELLDAAKIWSEAGQSRVLLTTRQPDFGHEAYPKAGEVSHRYLNLKGLGEEDAVAYFQAMMKLPPKPVTKPPERRVLAELFQQVEFHPLSVGLLANELKFRRPAELGERLEQLLKETPDTPLIASLNLSLDRLDEEARKWLPRLGGFQGGAMEDVITDITGFSQEEWQKLCLALENTGLIQPEHLPGVSVPYLRFHPTLAPALWSRVSPQEKEQLNARYRQRFCHLSLYLYTEDSKKPYEIRTIARLELSNLLCAVYASLEAGEEHAVKFAITVNRFLYVFGLNREYEKLAKQAEASAGEAGSQAWFLARSNVGEQLYNAGRCQEAEKVFQEILAELGDKPSFDRCKILADLGRCFENQGQSAKAADIYRQGLAEAEKLEDSQEVKQKMGALQTDLANALMLTDDYEGARSAYEASLAIAKEQNDNRQIGIVGFQIGTLEMLQGRLQEAIQRYQEALATFRQLNEPASEATARHQLGMVYQEAKQWEAAEGAYREAARIFEMQSDLAKAVAGWNNLAIVTASAGKPDEAEGWYRKTIEANKKIGNKIELSQCLSNLANLLQNQTDRLQEAWQLAEEALAIKQTLDPGAAEIWKIYTTLAQIADKQNKPEQARAYRRQARESYAAFMGAQHKLRERGELIVATVAEVHGNAEAGELVKQYQEAMRKADENWHRAADALDRILAGERDEDLLCEPLHYEGAMIIHAILQGIADPETLKPLLGS
jgi:tetratricopeptide (TPR) repeat protein